jgi:hypothetical protein
MRGKRQAGRRQRLAKAQERVLTDVFRRVIRREASDIGASARKRLAQSGKAAFMLWMAEFYQDHRQFIYNNLDPYMATYASLMIEDIAAETDGEPLEADEIDGFTRQYVASYAERHNLYGAQRVGEVIDTAEQSGDDPVAAVDAEMERWQAERPEMEGRREAQQFLNAAALAIYTLIGVTTIRWYAMGENCPYCTNLNGAVVGVDKFFLPAGEYQPDGAPDPFTVRRNVLYPPLHDGCDCIILSGA